MRITPDANILVRAVVSATGPAHELIGRGTREPHVLVVSWQILDEVRRVLRYERVRRLCALSEEENDEFVELIAASADVVVPGEIPAVSRDPDDDAVLATAVAGAADVLCTLDRHLRDPLVQAYCATFGIRVLTDVELIAELRSS